MPKNHSGKTFSLTANYINKIIAALNLKEDETIIEIGAGRGALTEGLVESGANVIAVELERDMIAVLRQRFGDKENFRLIEGDALKIDYSEFRVSDSKLKLVANLPYYISTAILQKLIEQRDDFQRNDFDVSARSRRTNYGASREFGAWIFVGFGAELSGMLTNFSTCRRRHFVLRRKSTARLSD